jgi:hypothetical protein
MTISSNIHTFTVDFQRDEVEYNKGEWLNKQNPSIESTFLKNLKKTRKVSNTAYKYLCLTLSNPIFLPTT